uniref:Ig-like domain-containing protein n=1 Tax=Myotis lucifugus TaxID=59463 RepID=G1Q762_MYOLU
PPTSPSGAVEGPGPRRPCGGPAGAPDATLRCSFSPEPGFSLEQLNIWQLTDTQLVHSFTQGREPGVAVTPLTSLAPHPLPSADPCYSPRHPVPPLCPLCPCLILTSTFCLPQAPYSKPSMTLEPNKDLQPGDIVTIMCSSYQGYPEAEVFWQDGQGVPLSGNVTTSQMANEQGLFDVRSVLRVVLGANGTYSCLVRNPVLQQDAHGSVTITDAGLEFRQQSEWLGLSLLLLCGIQAHSSFSFRKDSEYVNGEEAGAEDQDGDGEGPKTVLRPLKHSENKEGDGPEIA